MKKENDIWSLASKHLKKISEGSEASGFDRTADAEYGERVYSQMFD